jgi:hypothetical protein
MILALKTDQPEAELYLLSEDEGTVVMSLARASTAFEYTVRKNRVVIER